MMAWTGSAIAPSRPDISPRMGSVRFFDHELQFLKERGAYSTASVRIRAREDRHPGVPQDSHVRLAVGV